MSLRLALAQMNAEGAVRSLREIIPASRGLTAIKEGTAS
jgi:hypothetical protein